MKAGPHNPSDFLGFKQEVSEKLGSGGQATALLATPLLILPRILLSFWDARAHCWLMLSFSSTRTPKSFSAGLLLRSFPSLYSYLGLPWSKCKTLHFALLNLIRFRWANFLNLSRFLWMASLPSAVSTAPLSLVSSANLLRVHSIPSPMPLIKMLKSIRPKTDSWGTPLISNLYLDIEPLARILWLQSSKQFLIHRIVHSPNPSLSNLEIRINLSNLEISSGGSCQRLCRSPGRWHHLPSLNSPVLSLHHRRPLDWSGVTFPW